jgi:pimeloyl-ACP methyl ester carboxylesterase
VGGVQLSRRAAPVEGIAGDLAYGEWPGAEPAVVLVPGIFATHRAVAPLALHLAPARRVVAFDLRGRGRSPGTGPFGIERHASDLWRSIDALGLRRPLLCGHSLGAFVVAIAAARRPDASSGVVLLDGGLWAPYPVPVELVHAVFADDRARLDRTFPDVEAYAADREIEATPDVLEEFTYELQPAGDLLTPVMPVEAFDSDVASIAAHTARNEPLASIGCPVLVIRALGGVGGDPLVQMLPEATLAAAQAEVPGLRVVDIPESTHGGLVRDPIATRVADEILAMAAG